MVEEDFAFRTLDAASAGLDAVRRRAGGSPVCKLTLVRNPKRSQIWLEPGSIRGMSVNTIVALSLIAFGGYLLVAKSKEPPSVAK